MLPSTQRLRRKADIQRVYQRGRSWAHPLLAMHVLTQPHGQRVGISVGRKVGKAVVRNRVRRRLREAVRLRLPGWKQGLDAMLVARSSAAAATFAELGGALDELARRARMIAIAEPAAVEARYIMPESGRPGRPQPEGPRAAPTGENRCLAC